MSTPILEANVLSPAFIPTSIRTNHDIFYQEHAEPGCPTGEALAHSAKLGLRALDYDHYRLIGDKLYKPASGAQRATREAWVTQTDYAIRLCRSAALGQQFAQALQALTADMDAQARREVGSYYVQQITTSLTANETFYGHVTSVISQMMEQAAAIGNTPEIKSYWESLAVNVEPRLLTALRKLTASETDLFSIDQTVSQYLDCLRTNSLEEVIAFAEQEVEASFSGTEQFDEREHSLFHPMKTGYSLFDQEIAAISHSLRGHRHQTTKTNTEWDWQQYLAEVTDNAENYVRVHGEHNADLEDTLHTATAQFNEWQQDVTFTNTPDYEFAGYVNDCGPEDLPAELSFLPGQLTSLYIYGQPGWEPTNGKQIKELFNWFIATKYPHHTAPQKLITQMNMQRTKWEMPRLENTSPVTLLHNCLKAAKEANFRFRVSHQDVTIQARQVLNLYYEEGLPSNHPVTLAVANLLAALQRDKHVNLMRSHTLYRQFITDIRKAADTNELRRLSQSAYAISQTTKKERQEGNFHPNQLSPLETALIVTAKTVRQEQLEGQVWKHTSKTFRQLVKQARTATDVFLRGMKFAIHGNNQPGTVALRKVREQFLTLSGQEQKTFWAELKRLSPSIISA